MTRAIGLGCALMLTARLLAQDTTAVVERNDSIIVRFLDAELRTVIQALAPYLDRPVLTGNLPAIRVSLETPRPLARHEVPTVLQALVEAQALAFLVDSAFYQITPRSEGRAPAAAQDTAAAPLRLFVIRLKHARAADIAATVNLLFGGGGEFAGETAARPGTLSEELRRARVPPVGLQARAEPQAAGTPAELAGLVTIVPDELTNSLLVRSTESDFVVIQDAVTQLDIRPLQVLIEVLIVEVRKDRALSFGADITIPPQQVGGGNATIEAQTAGGGLADLVLKVMNLGGAEVNVVIRAAASRGDADIVSRPIVLASNNQEARILVGEQRPFVQVSRSLPTDVPTRDQVVQYQDVGTVLTVRPTINYDGYVALDIRQEVNNATGEVQFDAPVISTREASTRLLVKDGQTIVLGGLRDRIRTSSQRGVPLLSSIPILGGLFGSADRRLVETELFLFLTPRILGTDEATEQATQERLRGRQP